MMAALSFFLSPVGRYVGIALVVLSAFGVYRVRLENQIRHKVIQELEAKEQKRLKDAVNAETKFRRTIRSNPKRLHDDDGFRRKD